MYSFALLASLILPAALAAQAPVHVGGTTRSSIPAGSYATTLTRADFPSTVGPHDVADMLGRWTLTFDDSGHYTVDHGTAKRVIVGRVQTTGREVHFEAKDIPDEVCHVPATYTVSAGKQTLRFRKVADECEVRVVLLTAHPLAR